MYLIDKGKNRINKLEKRTFSELKFYERKHLQEWIANDPSSLGEELLIIQKEFSGFSDTNERLDLLALDKQGNLVVIENKLDDSGKDVTWQIIKYASYCSSLSTNDIISIFQQYLGSYGDAKERISEFFDNKEIDELNLNQGLTSQRLIFVAANFKKEITSSVLWLMNFEIRIKCLKVTPFSLNDQLFLTFEQILPIRDTEDLSIKIASKSQELVKVQETTKNRHNIRIEFWEQFINESNKVSSVFMNNNPTKENWIVKGIGLGGVGLGVAISSNYCRSEITFNTGSKHNNKLYFDYLFNTKDKIEEKFNGKLKWERMDEFVTSRISFQLDGVSYFEKGDWKKMNDFLIESSSRLEKAIIDSIKSLNKHFKEKTRGTKNEIKENLNN